MIDLKRQYERWGIFMLIRLIGLWLYAFVVSHAYGANNLPPEFGSAIRSAVAKHPEVAMAKSNVLAAKSLVSAGEYRWFPKVEVGSRAGSTQSTGAGNRTLNLALKQPLWDAGRVDADFASAQASESVSISAEGETLDSIGTRTSTAYFNILRAREQAATAKRNADDHYTMYTSSSNRKAGGLGAQSDVILASSRLQQAKAAELQWQGEIVKAVSAYFSIVNESPPMTMSEIELWEVEGGLRSAIDAAKMRSPILQKLQNEVLVAEANVLSKKAQQFPTLYARVDHANYLGGSKNSLYENDTSFTVNFEWQNDVAMTQRFQVEAAEQKVIAAKYAVEAAERQLVEAMTGYWQDFVTARQRSEELKRFENLAADTVGMFRRQFNIGRRSWPEVMNSLQDLYSAKNQYIEAKYQTMVARMKLAFMIGEMDEYTRVADTSADNAKIQPSVAAEPVATTAVTPVNEAAVSDTALVPQSSSLDSSEISTPADSKPVALPVTNTPLAAEATAAGSSESLKQTPIKEVSPVVAVNARIKHWVQAWSSHNVEAYLASYAPDFIAEGGKARVDWARERTLKVSTKSQLKIDLLHPKVSVMGSDARVSFRQVYSEKGKSIRTNKTIFLHKYDDNWLIVRERLDV